MNFKKSVTLSISAALVLSVVSITGFQLTEIIAEETEKKGHVFAENTSITGVFNFREGTELYSFEVYNQMSGFDRAEPFVFELQKVVGETPLLHEHADQSFLYRSSTVQKKDNNPFNAEIIIATGGEPKRIFSYADCFVQDYRVQTDFDKEEGWMGKGFAVLDKYIIQCKAYQPQNPVYDDMMTIKEKASAKSSLEYQSEQRALT